MKEIRLTQGKVALIDDAMWDRISYFRWFAHNNNGNWYAVTGLTLPNGKRTTLKMHQLILGIPESFIDHKDNNGLNNQIANIRFATSEGNNRNSKKRKHSTSSYKGVSWNTITRKWVAQIYVNGKNKYLGHFIPEHEHMAAMAYDLQAIEHYGEFANLNFKA